MRRDATLILVVCALALAPAAGAYTRSPELEQVSKVFANGRGWPVRCDTPEEWADTGADPLWAFAYTQMDERYVVLRGDLCPFAEHPEDETTPPWDRALAVLVLIHESYHVRAWPLRRVEGRVECQAIRHFTVGAQLLGATPDQAQELLPYALAWHYLIARPGTAYEWRKCRVPPW